MRYRGSIPLGFLLLFYIYQSADARKCNLNCAGTTGNLLKFHPGKTYLYKLEGHSVTTLPGAKGEASKVDLEANVEVSATSGCEHVLAVSGVHTTSSDGKKYNLDTILGSHPLKFAFQNGKVVDLCTSEAESTSALNVKRAVLSLLQSSILKESGYALQHETDVFGNCPTNFEFVKHGSSVVVRKTKDLTKCAYRENLNMPFSTSSYFASGLQSIPLLSGSLNTEQKLEGGLLKYASSEEVYNYNPLSAAESATKVQVNTKLTYVDQSDKPAPPVSGNSGKSLVFHKDHPEDQKGGVGIMVELLRGSCDSRTVADDGASKFSSLVRVMSSSPKEELLQVYQQVKSGQGFKEKDVAKKMYMDALVQANSASSIEVMAELLKHKEVTGSKAQYFYLLLGSVKHATRAALLAVMPLLEYDGHPALYLGAGALGGRFCTDHNCAKFPEVEAFQEKLAAPLLTKGCKPPNKKEEDILLASLKGLANMKYLTKPVATKLADYATDIDVKARIRVALLETMRSDANKPEFKTVAGEVFKNPLEDSEVRIKAYLVLAECPCGKVAALVKTVLETEKSYQVGGFVASHLRNLRATTNPLKANAKHHLGPILNTEKYPVDFRKYSQNFEQSCSVDLLNLGASIESNVIYSQQSYVPRSISLNLTSYMFGHTMNWFEVNMRAENLERELERVFGPRGKLRKQKYYEVYEEGREYATSLLETAAERYEKSLRPKRSVVTRDQLNILANKVDLHRESDDDVDIDVSLKLYGNELFWVKYHGYENRLDLGDGVDLLFEGLDDSLKSAKDLNFDYRKHITFLDEELVYPTGLGLPLKLKALGSSAFRLKLDGKFDVAALLRDPRNTDVRLQVLPSAAVEIRGDLALDGVAFEGGVKVALNLHTSTGSDITFRVLEGRGVDVKFGLPVKKQDVLSVTTDVATIVKKQNSPEHAVPVVFDVKREKYNGCFDQLDTILGVTVCGEIDVPWEGHRSLLPSYGPSKLFLHIDKDDDSLTYYHFKIYADEREGVGAFELLFDTPNSKVNRKVSFHVEGSLADKTYLKLDLKSPWTSALFDAALVFTKKELSLNVKFIQNEVEYFLKTGAVKSQQGNVVTFTPVLEYKAPEQTRSALVGRRGGPKHSSQVVTLTGAVIVETHDNEKTWKFENLALNTPKTKYSLDGTGSTTPHGVDLDVLIHYDKEHVKVKGNFKRKDKNGYNQLTILPSQYPDFNLNVKWDYYYDPPNGKYESKLNAIHGPEPNSATNKIYVHNKLELNRKENIFGTENTVTYPLVNLDGHVGFRITEKSLKTELRGKFDRYSAQLLVQGEVNTKKEGDYNAEIRWELMGNSVGLTLSRKVLKNNQSKFVNVLDIKPGGRYELRVHATHKHNKNDLDYSADIDLLLPADPKSLKLKGGFKHNNLETKGHLNAVAGNKQYLQSDFNVKPGDKSPSGAFKLKVPEYIFAQGDFVFDGINFKAKSKLELPKVQRKMDGKANFVVTDSKFSGSAELCWDTGNPEKTLKLQTDTSLQKATLDSKNVLALAGKKTIFNLKGSQTGDEGKNNFVGELELVLPNGHRVLLEQRENYDFSNYHDASGEFVVELLVQESGKEPLKVSLKSVGKNMDFEKLNFDCHFNLHFITPDKKDLTSHILLKKSPKEDDKWLVKGEFGASGSLLDNPVTIKLDSEVPIELFDDDSKNLDKLPPLIYHFILTGGSDVYLESNGKVGGNILSGDLTAKLPHDSPVTSVKWTTSNFVDLFNDNNKYKVKSSNELHWNNENFVKVSGEANCESNGLNYVAEWETNKLSKRKFSGSAHWFEDENTRKADGNAVLSWEGKTADLSVKAERNNENVGSFHLIGNTPEQGKVDLQLKNKVVKNGKGLHSELVLITKDKKIALLSKVEFDLSHPLIDLVIEHPDGKTKFFWKLDNKGEKHWASEMKAKWTGPRSGSFTLDSEVMLKSIDNFFIMHNLDAPLDRVGKVNVELSNRPGREEGKKITFTFKRNDKLVASASSNYVVREDGNEKIIEGNGNLKIHDQQYPLNFKGTSIHTENETAVKVLVKSGKRSVALEYQNNLNVIKLERTFCDSEGKCSKAQFLKKLTFTGFDDYEDTLNIVADLHLLNRGLPDVSYLGSYKRKGQSVDHLIEAKVDDQVKFKYHAYLHDKETGLFVTLPKRTVGAELKYDIENKNSGSSSKLEANLYLNKEQDNKLCLLVNSDIAKTKDTLKLAGEAKLTLPSVKKDLLVKGDYELHNLDLDANLVLDIFNNENEKVVLSIKSNTVKDDANLKSETLVAVKSDACKLNVVYDSHTVLDNGHFSYEDKFSYVNSHGETREYKAQFKVSPQRSYVLLALPGVKLLELDGKVDTKGKELIYSGDYSVGSKKSGESLHYNSEENHALYELKYNGYTLKGEVGILMRKAAKFNFVFNDKPASHLEVALDETNFLKTDYSYDPEVVKHFWTSLDESLQAEVDEVKTLLTFAYKKEHPEINHFVKCLTQCLPDFTGLVNHVEGELKQLKEEALADSEVSNVVNHLRESFGTLFEHLSVFAEEFNEFLQTVGSLVKEYVDKMSEVLNEVVPKITDAFDRLTKVVVSFLEQYVKVCLSLVEQVIEELKKYKEDVDAITKVFTDLLHEVGKQFAKVLIVVHEEVNKFIELNLEQLKELPITNMLKEKLQEFKDLSLPDEAWMVYAELVDNVKIFLPTTECEDFVSALSTYVTKVLKQEPIDSAEAGKELYEKLVLAVKSILIKLNEVAPDQGLFKPENYFSLPLVSLVTLPTGNIRWSTLNFLRSNDFPAFVGSLEIFAPSLNILDNIPPFLAYAQLIDSTEVITFDGRHYTVRGLCSYVLAEDYVDRNFSVVGHFKEGKLEAITAFDENHSVTLRNNAPPLKDGLEAEYPLKVGHLKAWKTPNSVGFRTKYGVVLFCTSTLDSCILQVSGFYFNKLRGLFGNLNYERYDDLVLPQGTVGTDAAQFCNSWKVENACPDVPAIPHTHQRQSECTEMFASDDSDLVLGRPWLPFGQYRDACDHLVAAAPTGDKKKMACKVAMSYVFVARKKGALLLDLPSECVVCEVNNKKVGDEESTVVTPGKAADVVILVDVLKKNEETYKHLVQPLVPQLRAELQKNGINDVHVTLVSFNSPTNRWTNYHSANGKLEFNGHDCLLEFENKPEPRLHTWLDRLLDSKNQLFHELGSTQQSKAYEDLLDHHNFRPHALKTIVAIHSEPCPTGSFLNFFIPVRTFVQSFRTLNQGVVWNLVTPINGLATDLKDGVTNNDVVGFTDEELYTLSKGTVIGEVDFDTDYCLPAVHATGGVVFPTYNFRDFNKAGKGGEFTQKTAELVVKSLLNAKHPLVCGCGLTDGLLPRPDCEVDD